MNQPFLWGGLLAFAVAAGITRLVVGHPLLRHRSVRVGRVGAVVAIVGGLALVFHCAAMFFAPWIDAVPFFVAPATMVRDMGAGSQIAYWLPAAALVVAWRRVWWPALAAIVIALVGVGVTMYWPYPLNVHLAWLTAVIIVGSLIPLLLLRGPRSAR
ncbi:hypothetical protein [Cryobacterium sp. CG_9.6]|uniref:hypothetical protein n=1 Tax=Cryobacterium sp. CG_9.6 TaxID=2760710 RepID=UPI002474584C|nr:hypothetical protein [Cryobacterium sp. CG_9.6]MDH6235328.1 hypothetical protein [Cryobacterium sp. CG_9.6]